MNLGYFAKINNSYKSKSKQETELWLINRNEERYLYDNVDKQECLKNNLPYEMLIIKGSNDYTKKIKSKKSSPFDLGDYINWNNQIWLITSIDTDDKIHCSGVMHLCTVVLRWQKNDGTLVERWAYSEDFTKYDSGKLANGVLTIASNQYGITVPIDTETKKLKRDMRFAIDFDDAEIPDVYILSNRKVVLHNNIYFNRGGTMILTMSFDSFDATKDYIVDIIDDDGNSKSVWICDYKQVPTEFNSYSSYMNLTASIDGSTECYFEDLCYWDVIFYDEVGNKLSENKVPFDWKCILTYPDGTLIDELKKDGLEVQLNVTNNNLLGKDLLLQIILNNTVLAVKNIEVLGGF